jgi:hypothetical protein
MEQIKLLGISGVARSGKDTFVKHAQRILKSKNIIAPRIAFADQLKNKINSFLGNAMGISAYTKDDREKKIIRPILVGFGEGMRALDPDYWINSVRESLEVAISEGFMPIISDVRYKNEASFVKALGGKVICVSREGILAANLEEDIHQPQVDAIADYSFTWPTFGSDEDERINSYVAEALTKIGIL